MTAEQLADLNRLAVRLVDLTNHAVSWDRDWRHAIASVVSQIAMNRLTTDDPAVVAVMNLVPECANNGCQFRKTAGYRQGEGPVFPENRVMRW